MSTGFLIERTAALAAAYVSRNAVPSTEIPNTIRQIHAVLRGLQSGSAPKFRTKLPTGSEVAASIRHDRLVSFVDGKAYKSLKRHLTAHGMTPGDYRHRYGLPSDYPMVSPHYALVRSSIAKQTRRGCQAS